MLKCTPASGISITMQSSAEIKTSMSCMLPFDPEINLLSDHLRPYQIVNGVTYPLGEFVVTTAEEQKDATSHSYTVEAYDLGQVVLQNHTDCRVCFAAGTSYMDAVKRMLVLCGIERTIAEPSDLTFSVTREDWEPGTSYLTIINALLGEMAYCTLWFDNNGFARLESTSTKRAPIPYVADDYSILRDGTTKSTDAYDAYNVFTVVVSTPDAPPMVSTAVNDSPVSPISTVNKGRRICAPIQHLDGIASQRQLDDYAAAVKYASMQNIETITFETLAIPIHQVGEQVILDYQQYDETGWEITLGFGGRYTHTARKAVIV
ncbi:MAG: hypothetical protein RR022_07415 [Angelakisella sp.]